MRTKRTDLGKRGYSQFASVSQCRIIHIRTNVQVAPAACYLPLGTDEPMGCVRHPNWLSGGNPCSTFREGSKAWANLLLLFVVTLAGRLAVDGWYQGGGGIFVSPDKSTSPCNTCIFAFISRGVVCICIVMSRDGGYLRRNWVRSNPTSAEVDHKDYGIHGGYARWRLQ